MLVDIVSKNGNLLLSVPIRGNGTIDDKEEKILNDIAAWMNVNSEGVFGTRPWAVFGEGPSAEAVNPLQAQGFNEDKLGKLGEKDFRFVNKGSTLYVHVFKVPEGGEVKIKSLAKDGYLPQAIKSVSLLGSGNVTYNQDTNSLTVKFPEGFNKSAISHVLKIEY